MRTRLLYNWEGVRGKEPLDAERKKVIKTYVNFYFPETRVESSWLTCVAKSNEVLRRKYVPKGHQLQGIESAVEQEHEENDKQFFELPYYTEDMVNDSIDNIQTPTFEGGFGSYRQYLDGE